MAAKRLYRSKKERVIWGVAGGLAQYFELDPVLIRVAFVALIFAAGWGILIYIILAVVVPLEPLAVIGQGTAPAPPEPPKPPIIAESNAAPSHAAHLTPKEPAARKDMGGEATEPPTPHVEVVRDAQAEEETGQRRRTLLGVGLVLLGAIIVVANMGWWFHWDRYWPVLLIALGVCILVAGMSRR
jgi:phage shock protein C